MSNFRTMVVSLMMFSSKISADDVQGDVILGFHKKVQAFVFFSITDVDRYRRALRSVIGPQITSTADVRRANSLITSLKAHGPVGLLKPFTSTSIAFTARGLLKLGIKSSELPGEGAFLKGQAQDAVHHLGDPVHDDGRLSTWKQEWLEHAMDGVCLITAPDKIQLQLQLDFFKILLMGSSKILFERTGSVRPGSESGKEHFGYAVSFFEKLFDIERQKNQGGRKGCRSFRRTDNVNRCYHCYHQDGITNPKISGFNSTETDEQHGVVDASTIITGLDDGDPKWTKNGSFLVFRELEQLVPEFNQFVHSMAAQEPGRKASAAQVGARIVGRWKSGPRFLLLESTFFLV